MVEEATEDKVAAWFDKRLDKAPKDFAECVRAAIDTVKYRTCESDPTGAAMEYVTDLITELDKASDSEVIQDYDKCKNLIGRIAKRLGTGGAKISTERRKIFLDQWREERPVSFY